jgi:hypothetical protein
MAGTAAGLHAFFLTSPNVKQLQPRRYATAALRKGSRALMERTAVCARHCPLSPLTTCIQHSRAEAHRCLTLYHRTTTYTKLVQCDVVGTSSGNEAPVDTATAECWFGVRVGTPLL